MQKIKLITILLSFLVSACSVTQVDKSHLEEIAKLQKENESLKSELLQRKSAKKNQIASFLTFQDNNAENAMNFYVELFDNSKVIEVQKWGKDMPGEEGKIMHATFNLNGKLFMCSDSPPVHDWDFSPAISNYVDCENEIKLERLFSKLSENGNVFMPLNNYGFSQKFGWVVDQYGVSWQLNLI